MVLSPSGFAMGFCVVTEAAGASARLGGRYSTEKAGERRLTGKHSASQH